QGEDAAAVPERLAVAVGSGAARGEDGLVEAAAEADGQALAGLAVGAVGEGALGEAAQLADSGGAGQDLVQEQVGPGGGGGGAGGGGRGGGGGSAGRPPGRGAGRGAGGGGGGVGLWGGGRLG